MYFDWKFIDSFSMNEICLLSFTTIAIVLLQSRMNHVEIRNSFIHIIIGAIENFGAPWTIQTIVINYFELKLLILLKLQMF